MRTYRTLALGAASLVLVLSACTPGGSGGSPGASAGERPDVSVGSAGFFESAVVAEMYAQALEANGYAVERHLLIGERPALHSAMDADEVNLIPEYLGGLGGALGVEELATDPAEALTNMQEGLTGKGWVSFDASPGTDADGFVVRQETAGELNLETMSDLAAVADQLSWGMAPACPENPNCEPGLSEVYGIDFNQVDIVTLDACSPAMADALNNDVVQVAQLCTTQAAIASLNFVLLEDDLHLQPAQNMVPIAQQDLVDAAPADFAETLNAIQALLTTEALTQLNVEGDINGVSPEDAARTFLEDNGIL